MNLTTVIVELERGTCNDERESRVLTNNPSNLLRDLRDVTRQGWRITSLRLVTDVEDCS